MQDHVSRLVGLDGFRVKCVIQDGDQLDLEVELVTRAQSCPHCAGTELEVHERPVVAVRDLPFGGIGLDSAAESAPDWRIYWRIGRVGRR